MKKLLIVVGIVCIVLFVLALLFAVINWMGYYHLQDGSADLYARLHHRMILSFVFSAVFAVVGVVCFIIRSGK